MALQLHAGEQAFLSGRRPACSTACGRCPGRFVEVTVPEDQPRRDAAWGRQVRTSWMDPERDVQTRPDGLRVATPLRTLFRLAAMFNDHRFERAAEDAWHLGLVTPADAADYLAAIRRSGRSGVARFERWLEKTMVRPRPSQSGLELDVLDALRRAGLPEPERQHPLDAAQRGGDPRRPGVADRPPRGRAGTQLVARRRPRQARRRGQGSGLRRDRLAHRPPRRVVPGRRWQPSACSSGSSTTSACGRCGPAPDWPVLRGFRGHSSASTSVQNREARASR